MWSLACADKVKNSIKIPLWLGAILNINISFAYRNGCVCGRLNHLAVQMTDCMYHKSTAFRRCEFFGEFAAKILERNYGRIWCIDEASPPYVFCIQKKQIWLTTRVNAKSSWYSATVPHVDFQVATFNEATITHLALVGFNAAVTARMQIQRSLRFECFRAGCTVEWSFSRMGLLNFIEYNANTWFE